MKIKILEVIRQGQIGGGESHLLDLINGLDKTRFEPVCLTFTDGEMVRRLTASGITCHIINTHKAFDIRVQTAIWRLIRRERVQLVHAHGSRAASNVLLPTLCEHLPFVYTVHGWSFHNDQSFMVHKLRGWSEKLICHFSRQVICVSQSNKTTGEQTFGLRSALVINNGVDLQRFAPHEQAGMSRTSFGFTLDDFVVGFIARCTRQKDPLTFLRAIELAHQNCPAVKALFVGEGDMDADVDAFIEQHQMRSYVRRFPFRTDVPELLGCIDAYCLPSLWEGLSIALLEAMAAQKPVIVTPTDGTVELIRHEENGLIVPFESPRALAEAICRFQSDHPLRHHCAVAARSFVAQHYNTARVSDAVSQVYERLIQK